MENNKIKKEINDIVNDNLKALEQLFPSAVKDGQLDVKALKEELGDFEEVTTEKYELNWSGKQNAKKIVQQGIGNKTLKFVAKDSKNADTTENIYIEGDNLEVLKLLRQNYYNSIKMIYIDPPYNTGNDFVYNDTFKMDKEESDKAEGIISENNEKLQKNQKSTNRYHANWLNMMYPRLKLARDLLTDDGVIFISIDDNEQANLKRLCDEIFGEENFVALAPRKTGAGSAATRSEGELRKLNDFVLIYKKNIDVKFNRVIVGKKEYPYEDKNGKYLLGQFQASGSDATRNARPNMWYPIYELKSGILTTKESEEYNKKILPKQIDGEDGRWLWSKEKFEIDLDKIYFDGEKINRKIYYDENEDQNIYQVEKAWFEIFRNANGTKEVNELLESKGIFSNPKPVDLIKHLLKMASDKNSIILDFFSGSSTTAHAVMKLNHEDGGNRKFIMTQLKELTYEGKTKEYLENGEKKEKYIIDTETGFPIVKKDSKARKKGYYIISEIGKERIRRAGEKIKKEIEEYNSNLKLGEEPKKVPDIGFKVFKVDDTNIKWYDLENFNEESQYSFDDPDSLDFVLGSNDIDIVYEIMLRQNDVPLSESLEVLTDIGNRTYLYASTYLICLETEITEQMVEKLASLEPLPIKFVFRDSAFKDNISLKDETFRKLRSLIERNSGESKVSYRVEFI